MQLPNQKIHLCTSVRISGHLEVDVGADRWSTQILTGIPLVVDSPRLAEIESGAS